MTQTRNLDTRTHRSHAHHSCCGASHRGAKAVTLSAGLLAGAALLVPLSPGADAASGIGSVDARIVQDFGVNQQQVLDFGSFAQLNPTLPGSITILTDGTLGGEVNTSQVGASSPSSGAFKISSLTTGDTFVISSTGAGTATIKNTASTATMTISNFRIGCGNFSGPTSAAATGVSCTATAAQSTGTFDVGAKLSVNANQAAGTYTGSYSLIVTML